MQATVVRFEKPGGPDVLQAATVEIGAPGAGQVLLRQTAIGVNYLDTYFRSGMYPLPLPAGCGSEAAGIVEAVGPDVTELKPGDRVAYAGGDFGSYADYRLFPAARLVKVRDGVSDEQAAACMLKGMTVEYLLNCCFPMSAGQYGLMYAAAGGVGLIAGQWARHIGAKLIGVAAGADKCALAKANGYFEVIDRTTENVVERVKAITGGTGVPVAYELGRQSHLRDDARLSCPARLLRLLRHHHRCAASGRGCNAAEGRLALFLPADARHLYRQP